jgi:hypothetical protein
VAAVLLPTRFKILKYLLGTFILLAAILVFIIVPYFDKKESKYLIGSYNLDLKNSKFGDSDISKYSSLVLTLKDSFSLSEVTPFFSKMNGTWRFHIDGDAEFIKCKFPDAKSAQKIIEKDSDLIFQSNILKNGSLNDQITFKRK